MSDGHPFAPGERNAMHEAPRPTGKEATAQQLELAGAYDHLYESDEADDVATEPVAEKPKRKPRAKHEKADDEAGDESDDE